MKKLMLLHTVKSVCDSFENALSQELGSDVIIDSMLDTFLANELKRNDGEFTETNRLRFVYDLESLELSRPDMIVVTCSSLSVLIPNLRPFFRTPIIAIDDEMCKKALELGDRIAILATSLGASNSLEWKLDNLSKESGRDVHLESFCSPDAMEALQRGDRENHDNLVLDMARKVSRPFDVIVLAQASMAHTRMAIERECRINTLDSPSLCIEQVKKMLSKL